MLTTKQLIALSYLRPNADFRIENNELESVEWITPGITTPTLKEINDQIKKWEDEELAAASKKKLILEKLGITDEEAKLLLS